MIFLYQPFYIEFFYSLGKLVTLLSATFSATRLLPVSFTGIGYPVAYRLLGYCMLPVIFELQTGAQKTYSHNSAFNIIGNRQTQRTMTFKMQANKKQLLSMQIKYIKRLLGEGMGVVDGDNRQSYGVTYCRVCYMPTCNSHRLATICNAHFKHFTLGTKPQIVGELVDRVRLKLVPFRSTQAPDSDQALILTVCLNISIVTNGRTDLHNSAMYSFGCHSTHQQQKSVIENLHIYSSKQHIAHLAQQQLNPLRLKREQLTLID